MSKTLVRRFKSFWTAEEVPRWFGLSLVVVYLIGLGSVGYIGMSQVGAGADDQYRSSSTYAVRQLGERLRHIVASNSDDPTSLAARGTYQRMLRECTASIPVVALRVLDEKRWAIASVDGEEIDGTSPPLPIKEDHDLPISMGVFTSAASDDEQRYIRVRLSDAPVVAPAASAVQGEQDGGAAEPSQLAEGAKKTPTILYLEAVLPTSIHSSAGLANYAGTLVVILVACGTLFTLFRCLRSQLRSVSQIAGRLQTSPEMIEQDLQSLQVADAGDAVTSAWNRLVELAAELQVEAKRADATRELSAAFAGASGGTLSRVLNAVPDGIIHLSRDGRVEYVNATASHLLGIGAEDKRLTIDTIKVGGIGGELLGVIRGAFTMDRGFEAASQVLDTPEGDCSYRAWVIPLHEARHQGEGLAVIRDVSQQVRAERAREDFVTRVTHELRTPLTNIRAYSETLSSGMFDDPKMVTECYNVITKETRRLTRLIDDILNVSQMEVGSIELQKDSVDLKALLSEGVQDVRGLADEKDIDLQLVLPAKLEPISADRDKLAVVFINIVGNAIKYTPSGGSIVVGCRVSEDEVSITVKDNGIGIDPADQARVFEKFQRADDEDVQNEVGSGIGLYTAREIARSHGGDVELMSEKGQGSTFIVKLPHSASRATALAVSSEA